MQTDMKSYVITKDGLAKMKLELQELKEERRPELAERIAKAKELGDLSENAEYHDAKDAKAFLEGRIMELSDFISRAVVSEPVSTARVTVGCKVRCLVNGKEKEYHLVGISEADPASGKVSNESPLGNTLLDRKKGEEFQTKMPSGMVTYKILEILC